MLPELAAATLVTRGEMTNNTNISSRPSPFVSPKPFVLDKAKIQVGSHPLLFNINDKKAFIER